MSKKVNGKPLVIDATDPPQRHPSAIIGGSADERFNRAVLSHVLEAAWLGEEGFAGTLGERAKGLGTVAMKGLGPQNELEGLLAAQVVMAHLASAECYRRAAMEGQTFEGRQMALTQAAKASRTMAVMVESLQKVRGEHGRQTVTVHHHDHRTQVAAQTAHLHQTAPDRRGEKHEKDRQPHARQQTVRHDPACPAPSSDLCTPLRCQDEARDAVPVTGDKRQKALPDARRKEPRRTGG